MSPITFAMGQSNIRGNELLCWTAHKSQPMWGEYLLSIYSNRRDTSQCWIPISSTLNWNTNAGPRSTLLSLRFHQSNFFNIIKKILQCCYSSACGLLNHFYGDLEYGASTFHSHHVLMIGIPFCCSQLYSINKKKKNTKTRSILVESKSLSTPPTIRYGASFTNTPYSSWTHLLNLLQKWNQIINKKPFEQWTGNINGFKGV